MRLLARVDQRTSRRRALTVHVHSCEPLLNARDYRGIYHRSSGGSVRVLGDGLQCFLVLAARANCKETCS